MHQDQNMESCDREEWPTELDRFKFDLRGFAIFRKFLSGHEVEELNAILDPVCARFSGNPKFDFVSENRRFLELMCDRRTLSLCSAWIGDHFRFAEAWGIHGRPQNSNLHAGPFSAQGFNQYTWTGSRGLASCLVFAVILTEQRKGDGGLVFVPGSHKASAGHNGNFVFNRIFKGRMEDECVEQPEFKAGDVVVFAEATVHGTECWTPKDRVRRNLYFKFANSFCTFLPDDDIQLNKLRSMASNEQERRVLEAPWVRNLGGSNVKGVKTRDKTMI